MRRPRSVATSAPRAAYSLPVRTSRQGSYIGWEQLPLATARPCQDFLFATSVAEA